MNEYEIDWNPARLDLDLIHGLLSKSYWSPGVPREIVARAIAGSLCCGLYLGDGQVGFGRWVTDRATFAYLADVFVLEAHRGQGLGKRLVSAMLAHPELKDVRRHMLMTRDAHPLYALHGFTALAQPDRAMERTRPNPYGQG